MTFTVINDLMNLSFSRRAFLEPNGTSDVIFRE
jgi:hypothetical protein